MQHTAKLAEIIQMGQTAVEWQPQALGSGRGTGQGQGQEQASPVGQSQAQTAAHNNLWQEAKRATKIYTKILKTAATCH